MATIEKYLYGAAVQGIQNFIFQTNKLKEIVGASEIVEEICTTKFASIIEDCTLDYKTAKEKLKADNNAILFAAGNIKYVFYSREDCERAVRTFPREVAKFAPGITVSQAVVKFTDDIFETAVNELENRLRIQRNKAMQSQTIGLMGIQRSRQTGMPVILDNMEESVADRLIGKAKKGDSTLNLCKKAFGSDGVAKNIAYNVEDLTENNEWIAVIHADGNGLGQVVQKVGRDPEKFKKFSLELDNSTIQAAVYAYQMLCEKYGLSDRDMIPIRPVVLGGDDLTVICRGDLALEYANNFIKEFERLTNENLGSLLMEERVFTGNIADRLTACAGIAFIKSSFPFYYGYDLAEKLCSVAKKDTKHGLAEGELAKSCLMFHRVQDSFVEDWNTIANRELMPQENLSFEFGPYYITNAKESRWTIETLMEKAVLLKEKKEDGNAVKSHLRNWMSLLHNNEGLAQQALERLISRSPMKHYVEEITEWHDREAGKKVCPVYDILTINSINNQKTK